jgi:hypothetical protein
VEQSWVQEIFSNVTGMGSQTSETDVLCSNSDELACYLIDDGSLIVASNQPHAKVTLLVTLICTDVGSNIKLL